MQKILSTIIITLFLFGALSASKPRLAPCISIWGKVIEQKELDDRFYYKIYAEYVNGHILNDTLEIYSEKHPLNTEINKFANYYFHYTKYEQENWELRIIDKGIENYKLMHQYVHMSDILYEGESEIELSMGWNEVFIIIKNRTNREVDLKINDLRLLNTEAYGHDNSLNHLPMVQRVKIAEVKDCKIVGYDEKVKIQPHLNHIFKMNIFIGEDYNTEWEYYRYKTMSNSVLETHQTNKDDFMIWADISYVDEMGITHYFTEHHHHFGRLHWNVLICSQKNDYCKNKVRVY